MKKTIKGILAFSVALMFLTGCGSMPIDENLSNNFRIIQFVEDPNIIIRLNSDPGGNGVRFVLIQLEQAEGELLRELTYQPEYVLTVIFESEVMKPETAYKIKNPDYEELNFTDVAGADGAFSESIIIKGDQRIIIEGSFTKSGLTELMIDVICKS